MTTCLLLTFILIVPSRRREREASTESLNFQDSSSKRRQTVITLSSTPSNFVRGTHGWDFYRPYAVLLLPSRTRIVENHPKDPVLLSTASVIVLAPLRRSQLMSDERASGRGMEGVSQTAPFEKGHVCLPAVRVITIPGRYVILCEVTVLPYQDTTFGKAI